MDARRAQTEFKDVWGYESYAAGQDAVYIPGVRDVIHLTPTTKISAAEKKAHQAALKKGLPSPLSQCQLDQLEINRQRYQRIKESPTPAVVRNVGQVLTWFDDTGDAMTTAAWGGKGALWLAGKVGIKVASRAVPYLGWALLAKDVVDLVNIFGIGRKIKAATGAEKAFKAAVTAAGGRVRGKTAKMARWDDTEINPFSKKSKISRASKLAKSVPGFGDILEIAQTTDQLFGVGISFGPAVGFAEDLIFGAAKGSPIRAGWSPKNGPEESNIAGYVAGGLLSIVDAPLSVGDRLFGLAGVAAGYDQARAPIAARLNLVVGSPVWDVPVGLKPVSDPGVEITLEEFGEDPARPARWPIEGEPEYIPLGELARILQELGAKNLKKWLPGINKTVESQVAGELIHKFALDFIEDHADRGAEWTWGISSIDRLVQDILEGSVGIPEGLTEEQEVEWVKSRLGAF